jgi:succinate dehydrogenase/fumarate reductase cytochrome b subunit
LSGPFSGVTSLTISRAVMMSSLLWGVKILMPFHLRGGVRQLGVDFAVMKAGPAAADQLAGNRRHLESSAAWR